MSLTNFQIETLTKLRLLLVLTAVEVPDMPDPENWEQNVLDLLDALALGINNIQAGAATSLPWSSITEKPTAFPPESHSHQWSQIQNKPSEYPPESHQHGWTDLTGIPATFPPSLHTHPEYEGALTSVAWADITGKPLTFPPDTHSHAVAWADVDGKPATFPPESHGHLWDDITDRPTTWDWSDLTGIPTTFPPDTHSHAVAWADVEGKPLTFPPDTHSHTISWNALTDRPSNLTGIAAVESLEPDWILRKISTGWVPLALGSIGRQLILSASQAEARGYIAAAAAVHTHDWSSITGKPSTFAPSAHGHGWAEITGKPTLGTASALDAGAAEGNVPVLGSGGKLAESSLPGAGLLRAWVRFDLVSGVVTVDGSANVSSVTILSTGLCRMNFATALPNANYCALATKQNISTNVGAAAFVITHATTHLDVLLTENDALSDAVNVSVAVFY